MNSVNLSDIIVAPSRQRQEFDAQALADLAQSIEDNGLISPIILRRENREWHLVAGERRLKALNMLTILGKQVTHGSDLVPRGQVPYIDFGTLSIVEQAEIEYAENAYRKDLTWQENVSATNRLHDLRTLQKAEVGEYQSITETAAEIYKSPTGGNRDQVKSSLVVAQHMHNPAVAKATSLKEAVKIIKRIEETKSNEHLAALQGVKSISERFQCYNGEAVEWLRAQPWNTYDVILTDPPYGMDADSFGDAAGRMAGIDHVYEDGADETISLLTACFPEWYRVAKPQAHIYVWCDLDHFLTLRALARAAGWWTFRTPLINVKPEGGRVPWPEHGPRRSYEVCLYGVKGKKPVTSIRPDVFESRLVEGNLGHGAQKPVEAYVELLKRSTRPGDLVLDTFAGTGTIFAAAAELGLCAHGVEMAPAAYGICLNRIKEIK